MHAAVVVELRLVDAQQLARAAGVDDRVGVGRIDDVPFGDHRSDDRVTSSAACVEKSGVAVAGSDV